MLQYFQHLNKLQRFRCIHGHRVFCSIHCEHIRYHFSSGPLSYHSVYSVLKFAMVGCFFKAALNTAAVLSFIAFGATPLLQRFVTIAFKHSLQRRLQLALCPTPQTQNQFHTAENKLPFFVINFSFFTAVLFWRGVMFKNSLNAQ